jgi:hypothetical protein
MDVQAQERASREPIRKHATIYQNLMLASQAGTMCHKIQIPDQAYDAW